MNKKSWVVFIAIVVAIIGGMVYMSGQNKLDVSDISEEKMKGIIGAEERNGNLADHTTGNTKAKVVLIEYGDYQCPGCSTAAPKAKALAEKYNVEMPIIMEVNKLLFENKPASEAVKDLMQREKQGEISWEL